MSTGGTIRRVSVIVAMTSELQHLPGLPSVPQAGEGDDPAWPSVTWHHGEVAVTAVICGIGIARAAAATESTIRAHQPDAILNFGCTGAHQAHINVGDVVIGTRAVSHAMLIVEPDGTPRYALHDGTPAPERGQTGVASDPGLLVVARMAAEGWSPRAWGGARSDAAEPRVHEGVVASADVWTQSPVAIAALAERHDSLCEDMEASAIAEIATRHGVPWLTIKDISNNELQDVTVFSEDLETYLPGDEVGRQAATLVGRILDRLGGVQEIPNSDVHPATNRTAS